MESSALPKLIFECIETSHANKKLPRNHDETNATMSSRKTFGSEWKFLRYVPPGSSQKVLEVVVQMYSSGQWVLN